MKNKILNTILMISLMFFLSACQEQSEVEDPFDLALIYLLSEIPSEITSDFELPTLPNDDLLVTYSIDEKILFDRIVTYEESLNDVTIEISLLIFNSEEQREYTLSLTQKGLNMTEEDYLFQQVFDEIVSAFPEVIQSNFSLPNSSFDDVSLRYTSSCLSVVRNRIIYSFPDNDEVCPTLISVIHNGISRTRNIDIVIGAVEELPKLVQLHITTEFNAEIDSKSIYTNGSLTVESDGSVEYSDITDAGLKIRLRGNSTLFMPKLSYKIKFDEKTKLLNDYAEKDWVLLANFADQTLIRTALAYKMSSNLEMAFTPSVTFVDLYINGEYQGNYMLTDQIEVTNDRIDIEENVIDIDTGYLVELDKGIYRDEVDLNNDNFFFSYDIPFVIKSPQEEDDHYSIAQKNYINDYLDEVLGTLSRGDDYNSLIDEASFIDWFIVNEVFKNVDSGYSSVFFYKDKGSKLSMGPVWDFDLSTGNPGHLQDNLRGPEGWYTTRSDKNIFFELLMTYPSFQENLKTRWNEVYEDSIITILDEILVISDSITYSRVQNFLLWDVIGSNEDWYTSPEILELETYDEQIWFLYDYLSTRIRWMNQEINSF